MTNNKRSEDDLPPWHDTGGVTSRPKNRMNDERLQQLRDDHDYRDSLDHDEVNELFAEIDALRAEAKYTDDAVAAARKMLEDAHAESVGKMANELRSLRADLAAARRERDEARAMAQAEILASGRSVVKMNVEAIRNRLVAAEAKLATARTDALEEAAKMIDSMVVDAGNFASVEAQKVARGITRSIRALKSPAPVNAEHAKEEQ